MCLQPYTNLQRSVFVCHHWQLEPYRFSNPPIFFSKIHFLFKEQKASSVICVLLSSSAQNFAFGLALLKYCLKVAALFEFLLHPHLSHLQSIGEHDRSSFEIIPQHDLLGSLGGHLFWIVDSWWAAITTFSWLSICVVLCLLSKFSTQNLELTMFGSDCYQLSW